MLECVLRNVILVIFWTNSNPAVLRIQSQNESPCVFAVFQVDNFVQLASYSNNLLDMATNVQRVIGSVYWTMFIVTNILVSSVGVGMAREGKVGPAGLVTLASLVMECAGRLHHLTYLYPELLKAAEPAAKICELLDKRSKIEPDPERDEALAAAADSAPRNLKPDGFIGEIVFEDVEFNVRGPAIYYASLIHIPHPPAIYYAS